MISALARLTHFLSTLGHEGYDLVAEWMEVGLHAPVPGHAIDSPVIARFGGGEAPSAVPASLPENAKIVPVPTTVAPTIEAVATVIAHYNNTVPLFGLGLTSWHNAFSGSTIHKIDATTARILAITLLGHTSGLPLPYALACLAIESAFDLQAENQNLLGSNKAHEEAGYDVGVAQLKLRYLAAGAHCSIAQAHEFALDATRAIPYFVGEMKANLARAQVLIKAPDWPSTTYARDPYLIATILYNFGVSGGTEKIRAGAPIHHADVVAALDRQFAAALGFAPTITR